MLADEASEPTLRLGLQAIASDDQADLRIRLSSDMWCTQIPAQRTPERMFGTWLVTLHCGHALLYDLQGAAVVQFFVYWVQHSTAWTRNTMSESKSTQMRACFAPHGRKEGKFS